MISGSLHEAEGHPSRQGEDRGESAKEILEKADGILQEEAGTRRRSGDGETIFGMLNLSFSAGNTVKKGSGARKRVAGGVTNSQWRRTRVLCRGITFSEKGGERSGSIYLTQSGFMQCSLYLPF